MTNIIVPFRNFTKTPNKEYLLIILGRNNIEEGFLEFSIDYIFLCL